MNHLHTPTYHISPAHTLVTQTRSIADIAAALSALTQTHSPALRYIPPETFIQAIAAQRVLVSQALGAERITGMIRYIPRARMAIEIGSIYAPGHGGEMLWEILLQQDIARTPAFLVTQDTNIGMQHLAKQLGFQQVGIDTLPAVLRTAAREAAYKDGSDNTSADRRILMLRQV